MLESQDIINRIINSEFIPALLGAGTGAYVLHSLRAVPSFIIGKIKRYFIYNVEFRSIDESFYWINKYLSKKPLFFSRNFLVTFRKHSDSRALYDEDGEVEEKEKKHLLAQGLGRHWFFFKGKFCIAERELMEEGNQDGEIVKEKITISIIGGSKNLISDLVKKAEDGVEKDDRLKIYVNDNDYGCRWSFYQVLPDKGLDQIYLKEGQKEDILNDIEEFQSQKEFYKDKGIPYRRTYMLEGPPGTGKTSFIISLARHLNKHLYLCSFQSINSESGLTGLFKKAPKDCIIVLEDIDSFSTIRERNNEQGDKVSFSSVLNLFDGVLSTEDRLVFLTTNHIQTLDKALTRPGRIDRIMTLGYSDYYQADQQFKMYYGEKLNLPLDMKNKIESNEITPAMLQEIFMSNKKYYKGFISDLNVKLDVDKNLE